MSKSKSDKISTDDLFQKLQNGDSLRNDPVRMLRLTEMMSRAMIDEVHAQYNDRRFNQRPENQGGVIYKDQFTHLMMQVIHSQNRLRDARHECEELKDELATAKEKYVHAIQVAQEQNHHLQQEADKAQSQHAQVRTELSKVTETECRSWWTVENTREQVSQVTAARDEVSIWAANHKI